MNSIEKAELEAVKNVVDIFVGYAITKKEEDAEKCDKIPKQFKDIIAFGKHLVKEQRAGATEFGGLKIDLLLKWMRKSSKNLMEPEQVIEQKNLFHNGVDFIIVKGKKQKVSYTK